MQKTIDKNVDNTMYHIVLCIQQYERRAARLRKEQT